MRFAFNGGNYDPTEIVWVESRPIPEFNPEFLGHPRTALLAHMSDGRPVSVEIRATPAVREQFVAAWRDALGPVRGDLPPPTVQFSYSDPLDWKWTNP